MSEATHFWDYATAYPTYSCGRAPEQGKNNHVFGKSTSPASVRRFFRQPGFCRNCAHALRTVKP